MPKGGKKGKKPAQGGQGGGQQPPQQPPAPQGGAKQAGGKAKKGSGKKGGAAPAQKQDAPKNTGAAPASGRRQRAQRKAAVTKGAQKGRGAPRGRGKATKGGPRSGKKTKGSGVDEVARKRLELIIRSKYQNPQPNSKPNQLESTICQYLVDLEASSTELKPFLRDLGLVKAKKLRVGPTKHAILIFVPFRQIIRWRKIQDRVVGELQKKFSGQDVVFVPQRKIMKLNQIKNNFPRPRNQTIRAVQEKLLEDIVYPTKIVGKRWRFRVGGKRMLKVYLDPKDSKDVEPRIQTYQHVYRALARKTVKFMFPRYVV